MTTSAHPPPTLIKASAPGNNPIKPYYICKPHPMTLGEAPLYRSSDNTLHWVDPLNPSPSLHILQLSPSILSPIGEATAHILSDSVSVFAFRSGKPGYVCCSYGGISFMNEKDGELSVLEEVIGEGEGKVGRKERRFNDGAVDKKGRFWGVEIDKIAVGFGLGKIPVGYEPKGRLWRYDLDGSLNEVANGFVCGNGVKWSPDDRSMYMNDSVGQKTYKYDFDLEKGEVGNRRLLIEWKGTEYEPDGMVIDTEGNLWMAVYGSYRVMVFTSEGKHIKDITFTAKNMTCPTWGGEDLKALFVTSASGSGIEGDEGGNLFRYDVEGVTRGLPKFEYKG